MSLRLVESSILQIRTACNHSLNGSKSMYTVLPAIYMVILFIKTKQEYEYSTLGRSHLTCYRMVAGVYIADIY